MENGKVEPMYEQRLLVFVEDIEDGNVFRQVMLNERQFKQVSDAILKEKHGNEGMKPGFEMVEIETGEIEIPADTFIGMESIND